jgi:ubiquinone/menaquinone biosynthesis C-methylase UbiE
MNNDLLWYSDEKWGMGSSLQILTPIAHPSPLLKQKVAIMDRPMPNSSFRVMSFLMAIRDRLSPRMTVLKDVPIKPGHTVLDYGCGPGSYIVPTAGLVGSSGTIYALDIHSLALEKVRRRAEKKGITNVKTIQADRDTGLPGGSIDVVLLFDIYHMLSEPEKILKELHRVLKPGGVLSVNDHHLEDDEIVAGITRGGLFKMDKKGAKVILFKLI